MIAFGPARRLRDMTRKDDLNRYEKSVKDREGEKQYVYTRWSVIDILRLLLVVGFLFIPVPL